MLTFFQNVNHQENRIKRTSSTSWMGKKIKFNRSNNPPSNQTHFRPLSSFASDSAAKSCCHQEVGIGKTKVYAAEQELQQMERLKCFVRQEAVFLQRWRRLKLKTINSCWKCCSESVKIITPRKGCYRFFVAGQ